MAKVSLEAAAEIMRQAMRDTVKRHSLWYLVQGALMILGGVLALLFPIFASEAVVVLLGWVLIISGIVQGFSIVGARAVPHFWLQLVSVGLSVVVGILFLSSPEGGLLTLTFLLIVFFMVEGIAKMIFALTIRPFPNWGWVLGSGVLGILIAIFLWANISIVAPWLLGLLLGIQLIAEGAALGYLAWRVRHAPKPASAKAAPKAAPPPPSPEPQAPPQESAPGMSQPDKPAG
ncbi:HdeD family acid-resistance protein [Bauldia sp.]|uniref:HdeD family acid-resistance protein n=1 Tax=Bauldia sp. TaxID=2575872 RepID=UPI003BA88CE8